MQLVFEKHVPLPEPRAPRTEYDFSKMEAGMSFVLPKDEGQKVARAFYSFAKRQDPPWKVSTRAIDETLRVWRVA